MIPQLPRDMFFFFFTCVFMASCFYHAEARVLREFWLKLCPLAVMSLAELKLPAKGLLAAMLDDRPALRHRLLEKPAQILTRWTNEKAVGLPSVKAMCLNHEALEVLASWWTEACPFVKTVPLDAVRDEACLILHVQT